MGFKLKMVPALFLLLPAGRTSTLGQTNEGNTPTITILVYNDAHVTDSEMAAAEGHASFIFRRAGVAVHWLNCHPVSELTEACYGTLHANEFVLHILPHGRTSNDTVFGVAFLARDGSGKYSDVFFDRVASTHREICANTASLLGAVVTHELGHLLLGSHAHSPFGIMAPRWGNEDLRRIGMGSLAFTPDQSSRMRARIRTWQASTATVRYANARWVD